MGERVAGLCGAGERVTRLVSIFLPDGKEKLRSDGFKQPSAALVRAAFIFSSRRHTFSKKKKTSR